MPSVPGNTRGQEGGGGGILPHSLRKEPNPGLDFMGWQVIRCCPTKSRPFELLSLNLRKCKCQDIHDIGTLFPRGQRSQWCDGVGVAGREGSKRERNGKLAKSRPRKEDAPGASATPEGDPPVSRTLAQSPPHGGGGADRQNMAEVTGYSP